MLGLEHLYCMPPPKVQKTLRKRAHKDCESQSLGKTGETMSSGHDRITALMNSQQVCWGAQNLHNIIQLALQHRWRRCMGAYNTN